ncbi:Tetratricopeptide TPR_4 [sediment metagenome]|uniref:Tetratricopeptide TPR_4 n=1 Tax=sediment metagenome TaxID=749907 RepID=D9PK36_9ZZZZ
MAQNNLLQHLKFRKDKLALIEAEKILSQNSDDLTALWGKAEVFRRSYKFDEAKKILDFILSKQPDHAPALICLSYIKYHFNKFEEASKLLNPLRDKPGLERENRAIVYMLLGSINAKKAHLGGVLSKVIYGTQIRRYFEKAKAIAPDLSEVHLGAGTFYLLAPKIIGGSIERAIEELQCAIKLTPEFATPSARLAQAYKKKGDLANFKFYLQQAKKLDPENEVVREIE